MKSKQRKNVIFNVYSSNIANSKSLNRTRKVGKEWIKSKEDQDTSIDEDANKLLTSLLANNEQTRYEGESIYQCSNVRGPFEGLNPASGVTLKEVLFSTHNKQGSSS